MKNNLLAALIVFTFLLAPPLEANGRRPGGGGGGGRPGGGFKPSRPPSHAARPPRPAAGPRPGTMPVKHPGVGPGGAHKPIGAGGPGAIKPRPGTMPVKPGGHPGGHPAAGDVGKFLGGHPPGHFPGTPGHRPGYTGVHKAEYHVNINNHFHAHPVYGHPFGGPWLAHYQWHYNNWPVWTVAATAVGVASWIGVGNYAGYGSAQPVPYYPVEQAPAQVYEQQVNAPAEVVAAGKAAPVAEDVEWLNVGTFGMIPFQQKDLAYAVQLATTKDGVVRGVQWDMKASTAVEVEGSIEKDTLRIAWQEKGSDLAPYFETNVDQLTQKESMVNVYNPNTKALISWQLIQIDEKDLPPKNQEN